MTEYEQLKRAERKVKSAKVLKRIQAFKLMYCGWKYSDTIAKDVKHYIKQNFGIEYNLSHVQLMSKKNFNYPLRKPD